MAVSQKDRSPKAAKLRVAIAEEELRLRVRPSTRHALTGLMEWSGINEQGEAMTLMIHHLHSLGPSSSLPYLTPPRHEIRVSEIVALEFHRKSLLMIQQDPGDEVQTPPIFFNQ